MKCIRPMGCAAALVALVACTAAVSAQATDPLGVLQHYYDARSRGDLAGAMSVVAPDATYTTGPCGPVCVGAADIQRREVEPAMANGGQYTAVGMTVSGNTVTLQLEVRNKITRQIGIDRLLNNITAEVRDGKIVAYKAAVVPEDPQTATYLRFTSSQAAAPPTPVQGPFGVAQLVQADWRVWLVLLGIVAIVVAGGLRLRTRVGRR